MTPFRNIVLGMLDETPRPFSELFQQLKAQYPGLVAGTLTTSLQALRLEGRATSEMRGKDGRVMGWWRRRGE